MATHADTVRASITGFSPKLKVHSFELAVAVNAIPIIQLDVLPIEIPSSSKDKVTASAPDIDDITKLYSELMEKSIKNEATATITLKTLTKSENYEELHQEVILRNWVLTDVGLSTVNTVSAPILTVVFSHPVCKLDKTGSVYEVVQNKAALPDIYKRSSGSDIIKYMDDLYANFNNTVVYYPIATPLQGGSADSYQRKVKSLRDNLLKYKPSDFIEGNTGDALLFSKIIDGAEGMIKIALGPALAPMSFGPSTWQKIITEVCPTQLVQIIPTYDFPQLKLEPCSPWQHSTCTVNTKVIQAMDVVSIDPTPIIGTAVHKDALEDKYIQDANRDTKGKEDQEKIKDSTYAYYFPKRALADDIIGALLNIGENELLSSLLTCDLNANANKNTSSDNGATLEDSGTSLRASQHALASDAYAEAMFLINYRKNCRATVTAIPVFRDADGHMIYPGRVLAVKDNKSGAILFYGYITRILVRGSVDGGGITYIDLSHARPAKSKSTLVDEGTENPCYPTDISHL